MGWSEAQLYDTSPRFFFHAIRAFKKKQESENAEKRFEMELHRAGYSWLFNLQLDKPDRIAPMDWFPFPWDEKPIQKTPEEIRQTAADFIREKGYAEGIPVDQFFK